MRLLQGVTLAEWLTEHGPLPLGQFVVFFEPALKVISRWTLPTPDG